MWPASDGKHPKPATLQNYLSLLMLFMLLNLLQLSPGKTNKNNKKRYTTASLPWPKHDFNKRRFVRKASESETKLNDNIT